MQHRTIVFNSKDRETESVGQYHCKFSIDDPVKGCTEICLNHVRLINSKYVVESGYEDQIYFNRGATDYVGTLTPGTYTATTILAEIKAAMEAADGGNTITATYDADTIKLTISGTSAFSLNWLTNGSADSTRSAAKLLGWLDTADNASATSQVATNVLSLDRPLSVILDIPEIGNKNIQVFDKWNSKGVLSGTFLIPFNAASTELVELDDTNQKKMSIPHEPESVIKDITARLIDIEHAKTLELNGTDWEFSLTFHYIWKFNERSQIYDDMYPNLKRRRMK